MIDHEVRTLLETLDAGFPAVHEMTGPEARAAVDARQAPSDDHGEVHAAEDRVIPGPGGDLPVRVYTPHGDAPGGDPRPLVVFAHGGGFVFCSVDSHDGFCREMAARTGSVVVSVAYRLAPEHPAPAAAEDFYAAVCWAAEHARELGADPARVAVAGDSAGGNLAAVACLLARERRGPRVAAQALLYPVIDPACDTPSHHRYATGYFNTRAAMQWYWRQYLHGGADEGDAADGNTVTPALPAHHTAPLRAPSLRGLPPAVVVTADRDPLSDEGGAYASALAGAGAPVVHRCYPGLFHGFATIAPLGAAASARALLWRDLRARLTPASISSDEGKDRA